MNQQAKMEYSQNIMNKTQSMYSLRLDLIKDTCRPAGKFFLNFLPLIDVIRF